MDALTPVDVDVLTWTSIAESSQRKHYDGSRKLYQYLQSNAHIYATQKKDPDTNIIDQGEKKTYHLPNDQLQILYQYLNDCRLEGSITHLSEKQMDPSGFMLDFDIKTSNKDISILDKHFYMLTSSIFTELQRDLVFTDTHHYVFYTTRQTVDQINDTTYKYGFHILLPGIHVTKQYKKWFLHKYKSNKTLEAVLKDLNVINIEETLDQNSASVPVLFLGSCKLGAKPYLLTHAFEIWLEYMGDYIVAPIIKSIQISDLKEYNLVSELSLNSESKFVTKKPYEIKYETETMLNDYYKKASQINNGMLEEDLLYVENSLSTLTLHNPEARYLHNLLDILSEEYYTDRNKWRDVIFALANSSDQYKPLAIWFSQKCPEKWINSGEQSLDYLWTEARSLRVNVPLTIASISYWAKISNPDKYKSVMDRTYFTILTKYVYDHGGKLQHYMISKVLHAMLRNKFCTDSTASKKYSWFEFVLPGQPMKPGEVWKWREEVKPDDIHIYMSENLMTVMEKISDHIEEQKEKSTSDSQTNYYKKLAKDLSSSKNSMFNNTFKNGVIDQCVYLFRRRGFIEQLDMLPNLFGVGNGILKLGSRCELIDYYHEYPVSRYTPVEWHPFNENNSWTKLVLNAIADIIIEPDVRNWILFHAAQGLSRDTKEGLLLLFEGGGQNGKTSLLRWIAKALGPYADKFNIQLLSCDREEADKPNSAMMKFKYVNWAYAEEANKAQTLNTARMKELVNAGEVSSRELNSKQETFTMKCNFVVASQYSFIINTTDHGTWRRLKHYTSKTKFCADPDPNNPLEKKDNQNFNLLYSSDPNFLSSMLSILTHYYERLQNEYNGELKKVPCPTLDVETEIFRTGQDAVHRWICENIVKSPDNNLEYDLGTLTVSYSDWYKIYIDRKTIITADTFKKEIMSSAISKYLKPTANKSVVLKECRLLGQDSIKEGEEYISIKKSFTKEKCNVNYKNDWWN